MGQRQSCVYSEVFKQRIVEEIESSGASANAVRNKYGIKGSQTVTRWLRKYGKNDLIGKVVRVETTEEKSQLKEQAKKIAELEKALAWSQLKVMKLEVDLEWIEEKHGISVKKKTGGDGQSDCASERKITRSKK